MMRDLFNKISSEPQQSSAVLRVIGDRSSGKTTYMASLARWPNADPSSPVQSVISVNEAGQELITKAQNLLEQGLALEPSQLDPIASEMKDYSLRIALKGQFSWKNPKATVASQLVNLNISCKDYAGEFFTDILQQAGNPQLGDYLDDCLQATGIMFLVDGSSRRKDIEYAAGLDKFLTALDRSDIAGAKRRISLVLTKCEQSELWVNRHKPLFLAEARFPQVYRKLQTWQQMGAGMVDFFTTSAFGMVGNTYPEPNMTLLSRGANGVAAVIRDPKRWRPFGLVAPIYWLCTGNRHKELDKG
jgi:GTPase SAR1 family protein